MAHVLIIGMTESGKTTLAKELNKAYRQDGLSSIVLDPINDPGWMPGEDCYLTRNKAQFLEVVKNSRSCCVFVDEAGEAVGQYQTEMHWLGTRARHYGHSAHFLCQRVIQVATTVRDQCKTLYLFNVSKKDSHTLADDWNRDVIKEAYKLGQGEFLIIRKFKPVQYGRIIKHPNGNHTIEVGNDSSIHSYSETENAG